MKKTGMGILLCALTAFAAFSQTVAVKSNIIYDATGTINAGGELAVSKNFSAGLSVNYNDWTVVPPQSWRHCLIQPEIKYWLQEAFYGHYAGIHGIYADYDIRRVSLPLFGFDRKHLYKGTAYGCGVEYGYHLYLSPRVNLAFSLGAGFLSFAYEKTDYREINAKERFTKKYFGPTEAGISIVYIIK